MKKILSVLGILFFVTSLAGCAAPTGTRSEVEKVKIVTTLFPLYDFARNIGGNKVDVTLLLPPGMEPHSFDPKPTDIVKIYEADVFVYTGEFMEPWALDVIKGVSNVKTIVVDSSRGTKLMSGVFHDDDEPAGSADPHIWLDFGNSAVMIDNIKDALVESDPGNASFYEGNATEYKMKLNVLDAKFKDGLSVCRVREIIYGGHYAFGYMAARYGLSYIAAQGFSPDSEPTPPQMISMVKQIRDMKVRYIFYEELVEPTIATTLSQETGVQMLKLNAAHNLSRDDFENGLSFLSVMENNLDTFKQGLECTQY